MFTNVDRDGTGMGFDTDFAYFLEDFKINIPVLVGGGAGKVSDYYDILQNDGIDGACSSNLFHFIGSGFVKAKEWATENNLDVNFWSTKNMEELHNFYERK